MTPNFIVIIATAFIPMVLGMLWYSPALFGNAWLKEMGLTQDQMKENQKPLKFLMAFICNILLAIGLFTMCTHEFSVLGLVGGNEDLLRTGTGGAFLAEYGGTYARFSHGVVHGLFSSLLVAVPLIGHRCLWAGKSFKFFLLDLGFWTLCIVLMSGIISQWGGNLIV